MTTLHMRTLASLLILMLVSCSSDRYPDLIIDTKVLTVDQNNSVAEAIAVKDGVIVAVGNSEEIKSLAGSSTKLLSFKQQVLVPGFVAAHEHPTLTAVFADTIDLSGFTFQSSKPMWQHLKQQVAQADEGDWIYAMGLSHTALYQPRKRKGVHKGSRGGCLTVEVRCPTECFHVSWHNLREERDTAVSRDAHVRKVEVSCPVYGGTVGYPLLRPSRDYAILRVFFSTLLMV